MEAAYDILLMQSLSQRRAGKVVNSSIRYADVKPVNTSQMSSMPQWVQGVLKNPPVSVETPSASDLGIEAGVYGALAVLTYVNGASTPVGSLSGADVPGLILATSFGASLYFMTKRNVKLGMPPFHLLLISFATDIICLWNTSLDASLVVLMMNASFSTSQNSWMIVNYTF